MQTAALHTSNMDIAPPESIAKYEPVIGLEVHVQLLKIDLLVPEMQRPTPW